MECRVEEDPEEFDEDQQKRQISAKSDEQKREEYQKKVGLALKTGLDFIDKAFEEVKVKLACIWIITDCGILFLSV